MKSDAYEALFALIEAEDDDFATLIQQFGIDPAVDLKHCDLSNVDFGNLRTDLLDLTGCDLSGADLSLVNCARIVRDDEAERTAAPKRGALTDALLAISRYQNGDWVSEKIIASVEENPAPVLAFYDTAAEQDLLTKRLCAHYDDASHIREGMGVTHGTKLLWFYSKATKSTLKLNPAFLDATFFETLRSINTTSDVGIYPMRPNQAAITRIKQHLPVGSYDAMRAHFIRSLRSELSVRISPQLFGYDRSVVLFSGFPPISKRLFEDIRKGVPGRLRLIFLCSSLMEPQYVANGGKSWRRFAVPSFAIGEAVASKADLSRLMKRIAQASSGHVKVPLALERTASQLIGEPLAVMKKHLSAELASVAASVATVP